MHLFSQPETLLVDNFKYKKNGISFLGKILKIWISFKPQNLADFKNSDKDKLCQLGQISYFIFFIL